MAVTGEAAQANIRAVAIDAPLVASASVRLAGLDNIVDLNFERVIWHDVIDYRMVFVVGGHIGPPLHKARHSNSFQMQRTMSAP